MPTNPFNDLATLEAWGTAGFNVGWEYNETTGEVRPDDNADHAAL
jgi:hypothetical protein